MKPTGNRKLSEISVVIASLKKSTQKLNIWQKQMKYITCTT